jgi:hypothetical protein
MRPIHRESSVTAALTSATSQLAHGRPQLGRLALADEHPFGRLRPGSGHLPQRHHDAGSHRDDQIADLAGGGTRVCLPQPDGQPAERDDDPAGEQVEPREKGG